MPQRSFAFALHIDSNFTVSNMAATQKPRLLMLGDPPQHQLEQWNRFQQRFDIVHADLSDRETFLQSLRDQK